jgi:hypothetical protein
VTKKKDVVQKFKTFYLGLDEVERRTLYDILTALRGPDDKSSRGVKKRNITNRIRYLLGIHSSGMADVGACNKPANFYVGTNSEPFPSFNFLNKKFKLTSSGKHYNEHALRALQELDALGYLPKDEEEET